MGVRAGASLRRGARPTWSARSSRRARSLQTASARQTFEELASGELAGFRLRLLHGQLPPAEKAAAMAAYAAGEADVLVSTSVIEVGVDVANATVMVILGARRFGLSQLHQLRGRVGRGAEESYCFLLAEARTRPCSSGWRSSPRTNDGFALAEADLVARGTGQLFGERQSGLGDLRGRLAAARPSAAGGGAGRGRSDCSSRERGAARRAGIAALLEAAEDRFGEKIAWMDTGVSRPASPAKAAGTVRIVAGRQARPRLQGAAGAAVRPTSEMVRGGHLRRARARSAGLARARSVRGNGRHGARGALARCGALRLRGARPDGGRRAAGEHPATWTIEAVEPGDRGRLSHGRCAGPRAERESASICSLSTLPIEC